MPLISPYKLFSFWRYLNFRPEFFVHIWERLYKKAKVNFNIYRSQTGKQLTTMNILPNISWGKCSQTVKFGQLIEYNVRNIFPEKSYKKFGETSCRPFPKTSNLGISLDQQFEDWDYKRMLSRCWPLAFAHIKHFQKIKRALELVSFLHDFWRKIILCYLIFLTVHISFSDCLYFLNYSAICVL